MCFASDFRKKSIVRKAIRNYVYLLQFSLGRTPVFIYQMGKVGSTSMFESLRRQYWGPVVQAHAFHKNHKKDEVRRLYHHFEKNRPIKIITPVREPIGRNISSFFQSFNRITGQNDPNILSDRELVDLFINRYDHTIPLKWFDRHFQSLFGINVFDYPFPARGWARIKEGNYDVLLLHHDLDNKIKEGLLRDFTGKGSFKLSDYNVSSDKDYHHSYARLKNHLKLPDILLGNLLESKYMRHFYSDKVISELHSRWSG